MTEKMKIRYPIIVEGKYDKIKLSSLFDAKIITTDGFGVFSNSEKGKMLKALSCVTPLIVATDSDGAGLVIRNHIKGIIPKDRLFHVYIPSVKGKEKRKAEGSKEGTMGVEGMTAECLRSLFAPFEGENAPMSGDAITRADFYEMGLSGGDGSSEKRKFVCRELSLPENISVSALLDVLNMLYSKETLAKLLEKYNETKN